MKALYCKNCGDLFDESKPDAGISFKLTEAQVKKIEEWDDIKKGHKCTANPFPGSGKYKNWGCAGGGLTYSFTPTGIGTIITIRCACGETLDLTEDF